MQREARDRWMVSLLREAGLVDEPALVRASCFRRIRDPLPDMSVESALVALGLLREAEAVRLIASRFGAPPVALAHVWEEGVARLDPEWCRRHEVLPLSKANGEGSLAMSFPGDLATVDFATRRLGGDWTPRTLASARLRRWLDAHHPPTSSFVAEPAPLPVVGDATALEERLRDATLQWMESRSWKVPPDALQLARGRDSFRSLLFESVALGVDGLTLRPQGRGLYVSDRDGLFPPRTSSDDDGRRLLWWLKMMHGIPLGPLAAAARFTADWPLGVSDLGERDYSARLGIEIHPNGELRFTIDVRVPGELQ